MPIASKRLNNAIGRRLTINADNARESASKRGYNYRWQKARDTYLKSHPLCNCADCADLLVPLPATVVDHVIPHKGDSKLFWDVSNWQPMSRVCHNKKTAREDGGWGN